MSVSSAFSSPAASPLLKGFSPGAPLGEGRTPSEASAVLTKLLGKREDPPPVLRREDTLRSILEDRSTTPTNRALSVLNWQAGVGKREPDSKFTLLSDRLPLTPTASHRPQLAAEASTGEARLAALEAKLEGYSALEATVQTLSAQVSALLKSGNIEAAQRLNKVDHELGLVNDKIYNLETNLEALRGNRVASLESEIITLSAKVEAFAVERSEPQFEIASPLRERKVNVPEDSKEERTAIVRLKKDVHDLGLRLDSVVSDTSRLRGRFEATTTEMQERFEQRLEQEVANMAELSRTINCNSAGSPLSVSALTTMQLQSDERRQREIHDLRHRIESAATECKQLVQQSQGIMLAQIDTLGEQQHTVSKNLQSLAETQTRFQREISEIISRTDPGIETDLRREMTQAIAAIDAATRKHDSTVAEFNAKQTALTANIREFSQRLATLEEEQTGAQRSSDGARSELNEKLNSETRRLAQKIESLCADNKTFRAAMQRVEAQVADVQQLSHIVSTINERLTVALSELQSHGTAVGVEVNDLRGKLEQLASKHTGLDTKLVDATRCLQQHLEALLEDVILKVESLVNSRSESVERAVAQRIDSLNVEFKARWNEKRAEICETDRKLAESDATLARLNERVNSMFAEGPHREMREISRRIEEISSSAVIQIGEIKGEVATVRRELEVLAQTTAATQTEGEQRAALSRDLKQRIDFLDSQSKEQKQISRALAEELRTSESQFKGVLEHLDQQATEVQQLRVSAQRTESQLSDWKISAKSVTDSSERIMANISDLYTRQQAVDNKADTAVNRLSVTDNRIEELAGRWGGALQEHKSALQAVAADLEDVRHSVSRAAQKGNPELQGAVEVLQHKYESLEAQIMQRTNLAVREIRGKLESVEAQVKDYRHSITANLEDVRREAESRRQEDFNLFGEKLDSVFTDQKSVRQSMQKLEAQLLDVRQITTCFRETTDRLTEAVGEARAATSGLMQDIAPIKGQLDGVVRKASSVEKQVLDLTEKCGDTRGAVTALSEDLRQMRDFVEAHAKMASTQLDRRIVDLLDKRQDGVYSTNIQKLAGLEAAIRECRNRLDSFERTAEEARSSLRESLEDLRTHTTQRHEDAVGTLTQRLDAFQADNRAVKSGLQKYEYEMAQLQQAWVGMEDWRERIEETARDLRSTALTSGADLQQAKSRVDSLLSRTGQAEKQVVELTQALQEVNNASKVYAQELGGALSEVSGRVDLALNRNSEIAASLANLQSDTTAFRERTGRDVQTAVAEAGKVTALVQQYQQRVEAVERHATDQRQAIGRSMEELARAWDEKLDASKARIEASVKDSKTLREVLTVIKQMEAQLGEVHDSYQSVCGVTEQINIVITDLKASSTTFSCELQQSKKKLESSQNKQAVLESALSDLSNRVEHLIDDCRQARDFSMQSQDVAQQVQALGTRLSSVDTKMLDSQRTLKRQLEEFLQEVRTRVDAKYAVLEANASESIRVIDCKFDDVSTKHAEFVLKVDAILGKQTPLDQRVQDLHRGLKQVVDEIKRLAENAASKKQFETLRESLHESVRTFSEDLHKKQDALQKIVNENNEEYHINKEQLAVAQKRTQQLFQELAQSKDIFMQVQRVLETHMEDYEHGTKKTLQYAQKALQEQTEQLVEHKDLITQCKKACQQQYGESLMVQERLSHIQQAISKLGSDVDQQRESLKQLEKSLNESSVLGETTKENQDRIDRTLQQHAEDYSTTKRKLVQVQQALQREFEEFKLNNRTALSNVEAEVQNRLGHLQSRLESIGGKGIHEKVEQLSTRCVGELQGRLEDNRKLLHALYGLFELSRDEVLSVVDVAPQQLRVALLHRTPAFATILRMLDPSREAPAFRPFLPVVTSDLTLDTATKVVHPQVSRSPRRNTHPTIGLEITDGQAMGVDGVRAMVVKDSGPADLAGIHVGDFITAVNGTNVHSREEFKTTIRRYKPEDVVTCTVVRAGTLKTEDVTVTLGTLHSHAPTTASPPQAGRQAKTPQPSRRPPSTDSLHDDNSIPFKDDVDTILDGLGKKWNAFRSAAQTPVSSISATSASQPQLTAATLASLRNRRTSQTPVEKDWALGSIAPPQGGNLQQSWG